MPGSMMSNSTKSNCDCCIAFRGLGAAGAGVHLETAVEEMAFQVLKQARVVFDKEK